MEEHEPEMVTRLAKVTYPKGYTPDVSRKTPGANRATLRDQAGDLAGHTEREFIDGETSGYETPSYSYDPDYTHDWSTDATDRDSTVTQPEIYESTEIEEYGSHWSDDIEEYEPWDDDVEPDISALVPLALVAGAAFLGFKAFQKYRQAREEAEEATATTQLPAGWYQKASHLGQLRYWDGRNWTEHMAQLASDAPAIAANWYQDPADPSRLRYWDGAAWTHHVSANTGVPTTPANWYADPAAPARMRYWDGMAWTHYITSSDGQTITTDQHAQLEASSAAPATVTGTTMTSADWQQYVQAWMRAGLVQEELWEVLTNAHISDADPYMMAMREKLRAHVAHHGVAAVRQLVLSQPQLYEQLGVAAALDYLLNDTQQLARFGMRAIKG